jgi:ABC-2 type transport system ATP-binding protein
MPKREREARARDLLGRFGLTEAAGRRFGGYSKGMKRKLTIAAGIIHSPPILFLDEPTTGIDVASARQIRQLIADLNAASTTIFLTTHYIEEAERLCQRIAFLVKGRVVRIDRVADLLRQVAGRHVVQFAVGKDAGQLCTATTTAFPALQCTALPGDDSLRITSAEPLSIAPLVRLFEERGAEVTEARVVRPSLEDVFVEVTGIEADTMKREKEKAGRGGRP